MHDLDAEVACRGSGQANRVALVRCVVRNI